MRINPIVQKRDGRWREGKGFSVSELRDAGIDFKQALRMGIPIDPRRRKKHKENVTVLKKHLKP